ncbi:SusC/RagA family TonB-linked outer membrane protein [Flavihumibacter fluvii]|uniref:SusC/RagA family TonB-linked outer membrane protein n=1 Tax=Flavihumibacter fluvii TaxID=2838157 RepID=UPI001BDE1A2A|nr:TonB-dependent receptor [Flavihumibacter fluvii]ULQ51300.1 TonB-dependent receptor [Flavihumibacter fluvii]
MKVRLLCRLLLLLLLCTALDAITNNVYSQPTSSKIVSGRVNDENGNGLAGVSVMVKNTTNGTTTDETGKYSISVSGSEDVLVFSSLNYQTQEQKVGDRTTINLQMAVDVKGKSLNEVVVVGYGTQRKVDLTGAVASVGRKEFVTKPFTSPDQILGGRVSGVNISNRSGDPGAPIDVRIRGVGTTGNNQPLWVIDGVPIVQTTNVTVNTGSSTETNPLAGINANDIESIDVLKDASASAIYGARAANGVIIVTTRRGKEGRTTLTYDGYIGNSYVPESRRFDMLGVSDYIALQGELNRDLSAYSSKPYVDWQDAIFQNGPVTSHNLSVSGGSQKATFMVSGGYQHNTGVERAQEFKRLSLKVNSDINVGKYFRFGESVLISSVDRSTQSESGLFAAYNGSLNAPYYEIYDKDGPLGYNIETDETRGPGATGTNYVWRTDTRVNDTWVNSKKMLGSVYGEVEPIKGLKYKLTVGVDYNVGDGYFFQEEADFGNEQRRSLLVQERPLELTTNLTQTLTYRKAFGKSDLTALVGYESTSFEFNKMRIQGSGLFNSAVQLPSVAATVASANEADHWAIQGLLARVFYSFDNKYLFTFNIRRDESSRFSEANRSGIFPSFSLGWRVSDEGFMKNQNLFSDLKLRASWGETGNQFTGQNFSYLPSLATTIFYVIGAGQTVVRGPAPIFFANSDLKWERSAQTDIGFDATMFDGKVDVTFDYFNKVTNDVLLSLPIPYTSGYFLPADANLGKIQNTGIELSANYRGKSGDFRYSIGGNITTVKNEVLSLGDIPEIITGTGGASTHRTTVGEPLAYFYGYKTDGIYQNEAEAAAALPDAFSSGPQPGDIRFVDVNGDKKVDASDRTKIGNSMPTFYYGFNISFAWKSWDFGMFIQGVSGMQIYNGARQAMEGMNNGNNQLTTVLGRWDGEGSSNTMPRATNEDPNGNNRYSDRWIESGNFARIKNIQLGYTLPSEKLNKATRSLISGSRLYFGINNLATFTNYKGYDPEVTRAFSFQKGEFPLANGQDSGGSPQPTFIQFGWSVSF